MSASQTTTAPSLRSSIPVFPVDDVPAAIDYYVDVLSFKKDFQWPDASTDRPTYAGIIRGNVQIHIAQLDRANPRANTKKVSNLNVFVEGIHDLYKEFVDKGATVDGPPTEQPYGMTIFNVTDPHGHQLCFAEPTSKCDEDA